MDLLKHRRYTGGLTEGHTKRVVVASDDRFTSGILHGGVLVHMPVVPSGLHMEVGKGGRRWDSSECRDIL